MKLKNFAVTNKPLQRASGRVQQEGATTVAVLGIMVAVSIAFGAVLTRAMANYRHVNHIATWQESLIASEAGSESGLCELRRTVDNKNAFQGWTKLNADGTTNGTVPASMGLSILKATYFPSGGLRFNPAEIVHAGEGNNQLDCTVNIDAPKELIGPHNRQWYRVRSTGTTFLPGARAATGNKDDHALRRLSFVYNPKTKKNVTNPEATRLVEVIARPVSFENAVVSDKPLMMNNQQILVDSYNSDDPNYSTNRMYDPAKARAHGDIATNSQLLEAGNATVRGDAYTNQGQVLDGARVQGDIYDDFYLKLTRIPQPDWPSGTYSNVNGQTTSMVATSSNPDLPTQYKMGGSGNLSVTGGAVSFVAPANAVAGQEYYLDVWVPQDFKTSGNGSLQVAPNVNVRMFVEGNIDIQGNGSFNPDSQPARLQILCVSPVPYSPRQIKLAGNGAIVAAIYGPDADVIFKATGSGGYMWGAITGRTIEMDSATVIHYDEALANAGYVLDYRMASWFEDSK